MSINRNVDMKPEVGTTEILDDGRVFIFDADGTWHYCILRKIISREEIEYD